MSVYKLDIRKSTDLKKLIEKISPDIVVALASMSNDPMGDLRPSLTEEVNINASKKLINMCMQANVNRFIFASSSSVYGENENENINENTPLAPITLYSKTKVIIEKYLQNLSSKHFTTVSLRPATVCGWSPRQRLDLIVNLLTYFGYYNNKITIEGGKRVRPHIHIDDMINVYIELIKAPSDLINGKVYNAGGRIFQVPAAIGWHVQDAQRITFAHIRRKAQYQGMSDAYTTYRRARGKSLNILKSISRSSIHRLRKIAGILLLRHVRSWKAKFRHISYEIEYLRGLYSYLFQICTDRQLKQLVVRNDWLNI